MDVWPTLSLTHGPKKGERTLHRSPIKEGEMGWNPTVEKQWENGWSSRFFHLRHVEGVCFRWFAPGALTLKGPRPRPSLRRFGPLKRSTMTLPGPKACWLLCQNSGMFLAAEHTRQGDNVACFRFHAYFRAGWSIGVGEMEANANGLSLVRPNKVRHLFCLRP